MKFVATALLSLSIAASLPSGSDAFAGLARPHSRVHNTLQKTAFVPRSSSSSSSHPLNSSPRPSFTPMSMSYSVGIVGATGAVGKEIRECLEKSSVPVEKLRIFGSARSAGSKVETEKYGTVDVELFDVAAARECDVVFLAVSGEFALEHAKAISEGVDGAVVIDNSVRIIMCVTLLYILLYNYL